MYNKVRKPSKDEQVLATKSYYALSTIIEELKVDTPEIEIEETQEKIRIPISALKLLSEVLKTMSKGNIISIVPVATEVTTQKAAEILGCSRPHVVKLLEKGEITYTKVGKHRRILFEDVMSYKENMKQKQKQHIVDMMRSDEALGLYDS
ncbi:helix-turn-helix domain-containing protein [Aquimarina sp. ERC-38]|uniref:helix-turn-helix domain-containing protein n=1 Tax=Aquimarina sp. ERC-38 TaxID=2949996 RepID=UPI002247F5BA|nr:helix-turn-helix domain-containing protein [Aquimarina sp. ERC-38]UZO81958.1 helix-turn-helix domain-containing protein [Aquimarina sp. ERC-38]